MDLVFPNPKSTHSQERTHHGGLFDFDGGDAATGSIYP